jgi:hypothetical protein
MWNRRTSVPKPTPAPEKPAEPTPTDKPTPSDTPFVDFNGDAWFSSYVTYVYENGIMKGTSDDSFSPNSPLKRGDLALILYRIAGITEDDKTGTEGADFTDVGADTYYYTAIKWAAQNGIVNGVGESAFAPDAFITREQVAVILYRYIVSQGTDGGAKSDLSSFRDSESVSDYAKDALKWATTEGLFKGTDDGNLLPLSDASRAEIAAVLYEFLT